MRRTMKAILSVFPSFGMPGIPASGRDGKTSLPFHAFFWQNRYVDDGFWHSAGAKCTNPRNMP